MTGVPVEGELVEIVDREPRDSDDPRRTEVANFFCVYLIYLGVDKVQITSVTTDNTIVQLTLVRVTPFIGDRKSVTTSNTVRNV